MLTHTHTHSRAPASAPEHEGEGQGRANTLNPLAQTLHQQAGTIDQVLASLGLPGKVIGGNFRSRRTIIHRWLLTGQPEPRLGNISPDDITRALVAELGPGTTWRADNPMLIISVPHPVQTAPETRPVITQPIY
jgi:hypothetical protein